MPKSETTYLFHQRGKWLIYDKNDSFSHLDKDEEKEKLYVHQYIKNYYIVAQEKHAR